MNIFKNIYLKCICYLSLFIVSITPGVVLADASVNFNGVDSYVEMTTWEPTGSFEVEVQLRDVSFANQDKIYIASSFTDREYLAIYAKSVQGQFGQDWPGVWGKFDFASSNYLKVRIEEGSIYASDGSNEGITYDSSISPALVSFDNLFRRGNTYSSGGLESITFSDLNDSSNNRTITFDNNGNAIVTSTTSTTASTINVDSSDITIISDSSTSVADSTLNDGTSSVKFNGTDSYIEMTPWVPTGSFKVMAWIDDVSESYDRVYLASNSENHENVGYFPNAVQSKINSAWVGVWGSMNFSETKYVEVTFNQGSMTVSDGVTEETTYNNSIDPLSVSYDRIFRRDSTYSEGSLLAIAFVDLNDEDNYRVVTFDSSGQPVVSATSDVDVSFKGTLAVSSNTALTAEQSTALLELDESYSLSLTSDDDSNATASDTVDTNSSPSDNENDNSVEMSSSVKFNGTNSYIEMTPWVPTGSFKVMAWIDDVSESYDRVYLASNSENHENVGYFPNAVQSKINSAWVGVWGSMNFSETKYVEVTFNQGSMTVSDGVTEETTYNNSIDPLSVSYDRIFRRDSTYSEGSLLAIAFVDLNDEDNYRVVTFDSSGQPVVSATSDVGVSFKGTLAFDTNIALTSEQSTAFLELGDSYSLDLTSDSDASDNTTSDTNSNTSDTVNTDSSTSDNSVEMSSSVKFNGTNSYIEMTPWEPTGSFKVMAWIDDVSQSYDRVYLASSSETHENIGYFPNAVQSKINSVWVGVWGSMNFAETKYVEVTFDQGSMTVSDGVTVETTYNNSIDPLAASYDRIFRRDNWYSEGSLLAIAFVDLNDDDNYRVITFDSSGQPVVSSNSNVEVSVEGSTTSTKINGDLTDEQYAAIQKLETSYSISFSNDGTTENGSDNSAGNETNDSVSSGSDNSTTTNTDSTSNDGDNTGIEFDGVNSYAQMTTWIPTGEHRVVAWLEPTTSSEGYLVSNSSSGGDYISFTKNTVTVSIDYVKYTASGINITNTDFLEVIIKYGSITISDGDNESTTSNSKINPKNISYDRLFRKDNTFSKGILQSIAFVDVNTTTNSRTIAFDEYGSTRVISDDDATVTLYNVEDNDVISGLTVPNPDFTTITDADALGDLILSQYPNLPMVTEDGHDSEDFAWTGHYWIRTYINLYKATKDTKYIDWAVELAEFMFYNTDDKRAQRNGTSRNSYVTAPKYYLVNRDKFAPGWMRSSLKRVLLLDDGMILSPIMRLVDVIKTDNLSAFDSQANEFMRRSTIIAESHNTSWSETKQSAIAGSWYYVSTNQRYGDAGLYSNPLSYNHSLAMSTALLYIDKWSGGNDDFKNKLNKIESFFESFMTNQADGSCEWSYTWQSNGNEVSEDINHGHIDVGYFTVAAEEGYLNNTDIVECMAKTVVNNIAIGPGVTPNRVNGDSVAIENEQFVVSYDYRKLASYEPSITARANNLVRQFTSLNGWSRHYLAITEAILDDN
ncbi:hypothetical protein ACXJY6_00695 [Vibrio sp. RC27]